MFFFQFGCSVFLPARLFLSLFFANQGQVIPGQKAVGLLERPGGEILCLLLIDRRVPHLADRGSIPEHGDHDPVQAVQVRRSGVHDLGVVQDGVDPPHKPGVQLLHDVAIQEGLEIQEDSLV